jgi:type III secretory pathway component EscV
LALDEHSEAIEALEALAANIAEDGRWRTDLVNGLAEEVATPAAYAALAEWLETPLGGVRDAADRDAASALIELAGRRYDVVVRAPEAYLAQARRELPAGATPLLLETDPAFFPDGEHTPELAPTLEAIDRARAEIEAGTGVTIPGVRIRVDPTLEGGRYIVLLREARIAAGHLDPSDRGFHRPLVEHVRRTVVEHLGDLAGFQDMEGRLAGWEQAQADGVPEWAEDVLGDERRRVRLVEVVQALVRERVCIRDLGPIIEAFAGVDPELGLQDAVESVRGQLTPEALGLREDGNMLAVPGDLEAAVADGIRRDNGHTFLALPSLEADELVAGFRKLVEELPDPVLVVRSPEVRPYARRVLEREHPAVPLLARSELGAPRWRRRLRTVRS